MQEPVAFDDHAVDDDVVGDRRVESELFLVPCHADVIAVENESAHPPGARRLGVGAREQKNRPGVARVRDPLFRPGDAPAIAIRLGAGPERTGIRTCLGFGQRERAQVLPPRERRDETRALFVRAEGEDRQGRRARVDRDRDADARVGARQLLEDEDVREKVGAGAPVLLRDAGAHQPKLGELAEELAREAVLAIPLGRVRLDLLLRDLPGERLDLALIVRQGEVHRRPL